MPGAQEKEFFVQVCDKHLACCLGIFFAAGLFALMDWECKQELWVDFMQFCQLHLLRSCRSLVPRALILALESDGIVVRPDGAEIVNACGRCLQKILSGTVLVSAEL